MGKNAATYPYFIGIGGELMKISSSMNWRFDMASDKYPLSQESIKRLEKDFTYHPPKEDQINRYQLLRDKFKEMAALIIANTPMSREQSLAMTNLETASFYANAAIARNE